MRFFLVVALLAMVFAAPGSSANSVNDLSGRWRVKLQLVGISEKNLIFEAKPGGTGTFAGLDTGVDDQPANEPAPAIWSDVQNNRVSFSGNLDLPIGTCCRDVGALVFKGRFEPDGSLKGRVVFIGNTVDEENFNGFTTATGTFVATRETK
jgi:hypothetical protein